MRPTSPLTVGQLKDILSRFPEELPIRVIDPHLTLVAREVVGYYRDKYVNALFNEQDSFFLKLDS